MWNHSNWTIFLDFNLKISVNTEIWDIWLSVKKCQTKSFYLIVNLKISSQFGHHYLQLFMLSEDQPRQKEAIHLTQVCKARKNVNGFLAALPKTKTVEFVERKNLPQPIFCILYMKRIHITFMTFNSSWIDVVFRWGINPLAKNKIPFFFSSSLSVNVAVHGIPNTRRQLPSLQKWSTFKRFEASNARYQTTHFRGIRESHGTTRHLSLTVFAWPFQKKMVGNFHSLRLNKTLSVLGRFWRLLVSCKPFKTRKGSILHQLAMHVSQESCTNAIMCVTDSNIQVLIVCKYIMYIYIISIDIYILSIISIYIHYLDI